MPVSFPHFLQIPFSKEIISIFHSIFDISIENCKKIVRENPSQLIQTINHRSNLEYIESDIKIVNRIKKGHS